MDVARTYLVALEDLVRSAKVPYDEQVQEQPETPSPPGDRFDGQAAGMGMPRVAGELPH